MGVLLALILHLCIIGSAPAVQGSKGSIVSPSPALVAIIPPRVETLGPIHQGESGGSNTPSLPPDPDGLVISPPPANLPGYLSPRETPGSFLHPPNTFLPPTLSAPAPQKIKETEPSISPSPSTVTVAPAFRPPVSTRIAPAPVGIPSGRLPKNPPTEHGSLPVPPNVDNRYANKSHTPTHTAVPVSPAAPPSATSSTNVPKNSSGGQPTHPISPAPVAVDLPKISPATEHGSLPPIVRDRNANTGHMLEPAPLAPPPATSQINSTVSQPVRHGSVPHKETGNKGHTPGPVSSESVASSPQKVEHETPLAHPVFPTITPSRLPAPITSPTSAFPVNPPLVHPVVPAVSPSKLPAPVGSPFSTPSRSFNRSNSGTPAAAPMYGSPKPLPAVIHSPAQDQAIPPSLPATSGQRHRVPPPMNPGPGFPPKVSPKMPLLPQVQLLPPPPPNEDCLSTVCIEPYTNSPPEAPCRCVWPMRVGLCLRVSLYNFFPLVSELASEIATGVFMKQSQVRIMGANAANQQPDKTVVLIDLVPAGEKFDNTTAFLTSDRFWHKQVVIKASYFGDYDVLYVSYPGLPPSPPLPPSSITIIDGGPYSGDGNNGRTIKPLGVDIQNRQHKGGLSQGMIAIIAVSVFLAVVLCIAAAFVMFKFRDHASQPASTPRVSQYSLSKAPGTAGSLIGGGVGSASTSFRSSIAAYAGSAKTFSMNEVEKATDNFHASRILGEGGFGRVYSGILEEGTKVAVKVLKRDDHHGDREFLAEVEMLSRLHHRNLVKLIGICAEDSLRCLVYELIPNGSVESHLHGVDRESSPLDWDARMKIALGAARGLAYLHEDSSPRVIHRDFKSSNILLEDDFTPKVSDFGLARTATDEEDRHISTRVMGTFGYVAPEYAMTGHLLVKSDVYSYGVVLLELLSGRKPVDMSQPPGQENLVAWARPLLTSKEGLEAITDASLGAEVPFDSVAKVAAIASMCVQPEVSNRPFMGEVVQALKLVCNECDEAKEEAGSTSSSHEDSDVGVGVGVSTASIQAPDIQFSATNFDSGLDVERGLSASELFTSSARFGRQESGSFRRHSYSGPLRTGRSSRVWQIFRRLSGGTVSEHGTMFKL